MRRLAFDTSVLAHLIRPTPAPGQEAQHADTLRLIGEQAENGLVYAVATPALAEILSVIGEAQVDAALTELRTIFEVLTFDLDAAQRCPRSGRSSTLRLSRPRYAGTRITSRWTGRRPR